MAEIYKATLETSGFSKPVIIKKILKSYERDPKWVESFLKEARLMAILSHSNIVPVFDFGKSESRHFLAMEFVDGGSVFDLIQHAEQIPEGFALFIVMEVLKGLSFAHKKGILHRDISPSNILISKEGEVKLTDFGIAKLQSASQWKSQKKFQKKIIEKTQFLKGKQSYMSPEQKNRNPLGPSSDLYPLGVVLNEMLTKDLYGPDKDLEQEGYSYLKAVLESDPKKRIQTCMEFEKIISDRMAELNASVTEHDLANYLRVIQPWSAEGKTEVLEEGISQSRSGITFSILSDFIHVNLFRYLPWAMGIILLFLGSAVPHFYSSGFISLNVKPWAEVYVGGKYVGVTPLVQLALPSGRYPIRIVNPMLKKQKEVEISLKENEFKTYSLSF